MARWTEEQSTPWGRIKYAVTQANLGRHLGTAPLRILDAGGGNGHDAIPLAAAGHSLTIVDYSAEMLADAARKATAAGVQQRIMVYQAELATLPDLLPAGSFDVVLCHNVLQYADDAPALLRAVLSPLKAGGLLSLLSVNRYALAYRSAFLWGDLAGARAALDRRDNPAVIFGATAREHSADEVMAMLPPLGCTVEADYGIRCITDYWGGNAQKADPAVAAQLEQLELALTDRHPYKLLARYFQVVARKHG